MHMPTGGDLRSDGLIAGRSFCSAERFGLCGHDGGCCFSNSQSGCVELRAVFVEGQFEL